MSESSGRLEEVRSTSATAAEMELSNPPYRIYLDVARMDDGRYRVQFVKAGAPPRVSYTDDAMAVVKQAQRAGDIPISTTDGELQQVCRDQRVRLIT